MFPHPHVRREGAREGASRAAGQRDGEADRKADSAGDRAAVSASDGAAASRRVERLSLVEVLVAELGAWTGAIVCRCHLPVGPFLASDGAVHLDLAVFRGATRESAVEPSAPE